jgi:hypothetical protein
MANKSNATKYIFILAGLLGAGIVLTLVLRKLNKKSGKSIIIGDSQTPFIDKNSDKISVLGQEQGETNLWKSGMNLNWLKNAVSKYPSTKEISNVVINIGTNGGFNPKDDIKGLVENIKKAFPKAKLYVVQGSWGWGGNVNVTEEKVKQYYDKFKSEGVKIIYPAIGKVNDPHSNLPIYKEIGLSIDKALN